MIDKRYAKYGVAFLVIFYTVGIVGLSWGKTVDFFIRLIPFTLLLSTGMLLLFHQQARAKQLVIFSVVFLAGFLLEMVGVNTGILFGEYHYSSVLGPGILETPFLIGLNWAMLIYMIWTMVKNTKVNILIKLILASLLMVVYDLVLEPFAIHYGMWSWTEQVPPIQNYLAWFVIAFLLFLMVHKSNLKWKNPLAIPMFLIQFSFFAILYFINIY
jgi:putative membrane protein